MGGQAAVDGPFPSDDGQHSAPAFAHNRKGFTLSKQKRKPLNGRGASFVRIEADTKIPHLEHLL